MENFWGGTAIEQHTESEGKSLQWLRNARTDMLLIVKTLLTVHWWRRLKTCWQQPVAAIIKWTKRDYWRLKRGEGQSEVDEGAQTESHVKNADG